MTKFPVAEVAFTGFRITRERPVAVGVWAACLAVVSLLTALALVAVAGPSLAALQVLQAQGSSDPQAVLAAARGTSPIVVLLLPFSLIYLAVLFAAINRAVLKPETTRRAYIGLGRDELRQAGLIVLMVVLLLGVAGVALSFGGVAGALAALVACVLLIYGGVRLSLASALAFDTGRIDLLGAWRLTRGRFWPLLTTYLLAGVMALVVYFLVIVIFMAFAAAVSGGLPALGAVFPPDMSSVAAFAKPLVLANYLVSGALSALVWLILLGPAPAIYQHLKAG